MRSALAEARKALGRTSPNPVVGCVIVRNGKVVARGHHRRAGLPHAEIEALEKLGGKASGATLYVNLEPCCHQGRTGPCTAAIIAAGVREVIVGMRDPNPLVDGKGMTILERAGIRVVRDVLEPECRRLNEPFARWVTAGRPHVTLKAAVSLDGRIAGVGGAPRWITGEAAREDVHRLRDTVDAVLVGANTVLRDNPLLTTRLPGGRGRTARRVVLDARVRTPPNAQVLEPVDGAPPTRVFVADDAPESKIAPLVAAGAEVFRAPRATGGGIELRAVLASLGKSGVLSVLVEGGAEVYTSFLREHLVDRIVTYVAPTFLGGDATPVVGAFGEPFTLTNVETLAIGADVRIDGVPAWAEAAARTKSAPAKARGRSR